MTVREPTAEAIADAAKSLREGRLVAFPTETVYGLGASAVDDSAIASIFAAKGRPQFNPLIVHVPGLEEAQAIAKFTPDARALAARFWPGPLTLVLPRKEDSGISWLVTAGLDTIAVRCPAHPVARQLLSAFAGPIAAPSANTSGSVSATTAAHVQDSIGSSVDIVLDGRQTPLGLESTIIGLAEGKPTMLRPGTITRKEIEDVVGTLSLPTDHETAPHSPGRLRRHYATSKPLRLNASQVSGDDALLAFGEALAGAQQTLNLSPTRDLNEAAGNPFAMLRHLDQSAAREIAVMPIPSTGIGEAINDRLMRAAVRD